ncbi:MAG: hypothetical protein HYU64_19830 [Armatimonadetes bacterium]|nr:hypothetical protein [Armatimonadota bacterium]
MEGLIALTALVLIFGLALGYHGHETRKICGVWADFAEKKGLCYYHSLYWAEHARSPWNVRGWLRPSSDKGQKEHEAFQEHIKETWLLSRIPLPRLAPFLEMLSLESDICGRSGRYGCIYGICERLPFAVCVRRPGQATGAFHFMLIVLPSCPHGLYVGLRNASFFWEGDFSGMAEMKTDDSAFDRLFVVKSSDQADLAWLTRERRQILAESQKTRLLMDIFRGGLSVYFSRPGVLDDREEFEELYHRIGKLAHLLNE